MADCAAAAARRRPGSDVFAMPLAGGSKSQENVQRQGFALLYARAVLVRPPCAPGSRPDRSDQSTNQ